MNTLLAALLTAAAAVLVSAGLRPRPTVPAREPALDAEDARLRERYRRWDAGMRRAKSDSLLVEVHDGVKGICHEAFRRGEGVVVAGERLRWSTIDDGQLGRVQLTGGRHIRYVVTEADHPELYALRREAEWLARSADDME